MGRLANALLLVLLTAAFLTGWLAFAFASAPARWSLALHAGAGFAILAVIPWKARVMGRGIGRRRPGRLASILLAGLVSASIVGGLLHSTGLLVAWGAFTAMELHVGAALLAVPLAIWHVIARPVRVRLTDLRRRRALRMAAAVALAGAGYASSELLVRAAGLPGARRRLTGSYELGSGDPDQLPATSWLLDAVPAIEPSTWRLAIGDRRWSLAELDAHGDHLVAVLDCTGGFWSEQEWGGVWLRRLVTATLGVESVLAVSHTGYQRRFPATELEGLFLATRIGGRPLDPGHGAPLRLVVPGWRGFWWVKWVTEVRLDSLPWWWQPPFPLR